MGGHRVICNGMRAEGRQQSLLRVVLGAANANSLAPDAWTLFQPHR